MRRAFVRHQVKRLYGSQDLKQTNEQIQTLKRNSTSDNDHALFAEVISLSLSLPPSLPALSAFVHILIYARADREEIGALLSVYES